jgi:hypothetical protein
MAKTHFMSRNEAAKALSVTQRAVDAICRKNGIERHQIPNHPRYFFKREAIENLVKASGMDSATVQATTVGGSA